MTYFTSNLIRIIISEIIISLYYITDFILPDWTIFSPIRKIFANFFWDIHKKSRIRKYFYATHLGNLKIGKNCFVNRKNLFDNAARIEIGDNCSIGFDNKFLTVSHIEKDKIRYENQKSFYSKPIKIGDSVWITSNCIVLPGTKIGNNVILSAGSIANGELESGWVYRGNPAIKIRKTKGIIKKIL
ncbi:acyltransferase [Candidatus Pacearchaeota archaeon]|nr:acyltransferase [Candidatus Pacearchaeota archaeon]